MKFCPCYTLRYPDQVRYLQHFFPVESQLGRGEVLLLDEFLDDGLKVGVAPLHQDVQLALAGHGVGLVLEVKHPVEVELNVLGNRKCPLLTMKLNHNKCHMAKCQMAKCHIWLHDQMSYLVIWPNVIFGYMTKCYMAKCQIWFHDQMSHD